MTYNQDRVERERAAHEDDDVLARAYALKRRFPHTTRTPAFRKMETDIASMTDNLEGRDVLDFGCGRGEMAVDLLDGGARVTGIDISSVYINAAAEAAGAAGHDPSRFEFKVMDAHKLEFDDAAFDLVIGRGILHHLDFDRALEEVHRVLRPGGQAVFLEPLGSNPLLRVFRALTPKARTEDERPFYASDLRRFRETWNDHSWYYGLFTAPVSMATSVFMRNSLDNSALNAAWRLEQVFHRRRWLNSWNQYVLLRLQKPK